VEGYLEEEDEVGENVKEIRNLSIYAETKGGGGSGREKIVGRFFVARVWKGMAARTGREKGNA